MGVFELASQLADNQVTSNFVYDTVLFWWNVIISIFFREVRPRGAYHIPRDGPVIFAAAPHHNQFLDLLLALHVYRETGRRVQFLVAAKSMSRGAVGFFARLLRSIPVVRATDETSPGTGKVVLSDSDPCVVIGLGTRFLTELAPKMQIMLPKSVGSVVAEVVEVHSDTELRIKREFGGESGKGTAMVRERLHQLESDAKQAVGLEFKKMPHVDQHETYHHVYECLKEGGCIVIFPEGGSHDRTDLLPLKAGVSLMALGAMANNVGLKVKIVPVGLSYFHPHKFRSRAVVEFGTAMDVPQELVTMFQQGGPQKREAVGKLLNIIYDGLKTVTIRAPDYDTLMFIQAARRLYVTPGQHLTLSQVVQLNKRFLESYLIFKDDSRVQKLRAEILRYSRLLRTLGLRDHQVPAARHASWKTLGLFTYRILLITVWSVLALPGVTLNAPIFLTAKIMSRKKAKEALAASSVKVAARDVIGSWKVLISLGLTPILYGFYAFLATSLMVRANAPFAWIMWTPFAVMIALPLIGYAALKFGEAGMDVLKSLGPLIVALTPGQQRRLEQLKATRARLAKEVTALIDDYGPKVYSGFEKSRLRASSVSLPPQKMSGGQGQLLVHPMTWLDERLFGWSRSATGGQNVWSGSEQTGSTSADPVMDLSDDEIGDYDDLLGYLDGKEPSHAGRSGKHSSYADLQKLRRSSNAQVIGSYPVPSADVTHPNSSADKDGLRVRVTRSSVE